MAVGRHSSGNARQCGMDVGMQGSGDAQQWGCKAAGMQGSGDAQQRGGTAEGRHSSGDAQQWGCKAAGTHSRGDAQQWGGTIEGLHGSGEAQRGWGGQQGECPAVGVHSSIKQQTRCIPQFPGCHHQCHCSPPTGPSGRTPHGTLAAVDPQHSCTTVNGRSVQA